jgi:hypothetical protein
VGYYLFALLFLMFDVEAMFLFPWAVVMRSLGPQGLLSVLFFMFILVLGLAYAWRKEEHRFDIEHQEQQGEQIITHAELHPRAAARRYTTFVSLFLLCVVRTGSNGLGQRYHDAHKRNTCHQYGY